MIRYPLSRFGLRHSAILVAMFLAFGVVLATGSRASHAQDQLSIGAWTVQCQQPQDCISYYVVPGLQIFIGKAAEDQSKMFVEIRVLATTGSGQPVSIQVDDGWTGAMEVAGCNAEYCSFALDLALNQELVNQFRVSQMARVAYLSEGTIVIFPVSLSGFSKAMDLVTQG